jgi:hypothetical protein
MNKMMIGKLSSTLLSLYMCAASAPMTAVAFEDSISAESSMGLRLLSKARQLENKNNNYYY